MIDELIQKAAQTIVDLGISTQEALTPFVQAWAKRPPVSETTDEDQDLANFLTGLFRAGVINRSQGRTLLGMLTAQGGVGPTTVVPVDSDAPPDDPYVGRRFGSFVAEALIGEGAMGKVYRAARKGTLERDFVIKVFGSRDEESVARFRRGEVDRLQAARQHLALGDGALARAGAAQHEADRWRTGSTGRLGRRRGNGSLGIGHPTSLRGACGPAWNGEVSWLRLTGDGPLPGHRASGMMSVVSPLQLRGQRRPVPTRAAPASLVSFRGGT